VIFVHLGDVVRVGGMVDDSRETQWSDLCVVWRVGRGAIYLAQIVEDEGQQVLASVGTAHSAVRHEEGMARWTPIQMAAAFILGHYDVSKELNGDAYEAAYAINALVDRLTQRGHESPWEYS
jgi:hypothetical protein